MYNWQEWIGYLGSFMVAISLLMSSFKKLRWINMIGSAIFVAYGFFIASSPVILMNTFLVFVNLWYLLTFHKSIPTTLIKGQKDDELFLKFYGHVEDDLLKLNPKFKLDTVCDDVFLIYANFELLGFKLLLNSLEIEDKHLVYVTPEYRNRVTVN